MGAECLPPHREVMRGHSRCLPDVSFGETLALPLDDLIETALAKSAAPLNWNGEGQTKASQHGERPIANVH